MEEIWKPVPGFEKFYEVSDLGNFRNISGRVLKKTINKSGYQLLVLYSDTKRFFVNAHRIVAKAFIGDSELQVDHINGIRSDNRLENLRYVTNRENVTYGLIRSGKFNGGSSLRKDINKWQVQIRHNGKRKNLGYFNTKEEANIVYQNALLNVTL